MIALTLAEITAAVGGDLRVAGEDTTETVVDGLVDTDSRTMGPGSIFVAKPGAETDGHRFVEMAFANGAVAAVVDREVDGPHVRVNDTTKALEKLGAAARARSDSASGASDNTQRVPATSAGCIRCS